MKIEDLEKLTSNVSLIQHQLCMEGRVFVFLAIRDGIVITCDIKNAHSLQKWTESSFENLSVYEPPRAKVKLYLYSLSVISLGMCDSVFYSEDFKLKWNGEQVRDNKLCGNEVFWKKTNTFIEVEA